MGRIGILWWRVTGGAEQRSSECGSGGGNTCQQDYTWSGVIRFTKHKFKAG